MCVGLVGFFLLCRDCLEWAAGVAHEEGPVCGAEGFTCGRYCCYSGLGCSGVSVYVVYQRNFPSIDNIRVNGVLAIGIEAFEIMCLHNSPYCIFRRVFAFQFVFVCSISESH